VNYPVFPVIILFRSDLDDRKNKKRQADVSASLPGCWYRPLVPSEALKG
jgi:hypothetical protein